MAFVEPRPRAVTVISILLGVVCVILLYVGAHTLEGYVLIPLVQKRAAHLPPALTLFSVRPI